MKIQKVILENFRSFQDKTTINFNNFTAFIGKNDHGKSTILEAIAIFLGSNSLKFEKTDHCVHSGLMESKISIVFSDFPKELVLDSTSITSLEEENLLNDDRLLEICKIYRDGKEKEIYIICNHPDSKDLGDLLSLKIDKLRERANKLGVNLENVNETSNTALRKAIREHFSGQYTLTLKEIKTGEEGAKNIYEKLKNYFPQFELFRADRENNDADGEAQDPLKIATKQVLADFNQDLEKIKDGIRTRLQEISKLTLEKLHEISPSLANELKPDFSNDKVDWIKAFSFEIKSENDIPLNKRGSGTRRLVLLNFLRAEAERKNKTAFDENSIPRTTIYAIEEPETSLHPDLQIKLIKTLQSLSENPQHQVIITTHSPALAQLINLEDINYLFKDPENYITRIESGNEENFVHIADTLGVLPSVHIKDSVDNLKVIVCVEGFTDIIFFKNISKYFEIDFENDIRILIIETGGSSLKHWVEKDYLKKLNKPEIHIYDSDLKFDGDSISPEKFNYLDKIHLRSNGSKLIFTEKREIENYFHPLLINQNYNINLLIKEFENIVLKNEWDFIDLPDVIVAKKKEKNINTKPLKVKKILAEEISNKIEVAHLKELNAFDEIKEWFDEIKKHLS